MGLRRLTPFENGWVKMVIGHSLCQERERGCARRARQKQARAWQRANVTRIGGQEHLGLWDGRSSILPHESQRELGWRIHKVVLFMRCSLAVHHRPFRKLPKLQKSEGVKVRAGRRMRV